MLFLNNASASNIDDNNCTHFYRNISETPFKEMLNNNQKNKYYISCKNAEFGSILITITHPYNKQKNNIIYTDTKSHLRNVYLKKTNTYVSIIEGVSTLTATGTGSQAVTVVALTYTQQNNMTNVYQIDGHYHRHTEKSVHFHPNHGFDYIYILDNKEYIIEDGTIKEGAITEYIPFSNAHMKGLSHLRKDHIKNIKNNKRNSLINIFRDATFLSYLRRYSGKYYSALNYYYARRQMVNLIHDRYLISSTNNIYRTGGDSFIVIDTHTNEFITIFNTNGAPYAPHLERGGIYVITNMKDYMEKLKYLMSFDEEIHDFLHHDIIDSYQENKNTQSNEHSDKSDSEKVFDYIQERASNVIVEKILEWGIYIGAKAIFK